ncbi:MAG: protein kinase [Myxococcales bacterium]|nr:protein kinase [Myxococcales bacterium]
MTDLVRCGLAFSTPEEFRAAFVARGAGRCFVPYPDELLDGQVVIVDATVGDHARLEVSGVVLQPDFDESGNIGVLVQLDEASAAAVKTLDSKLASPTSTTEPMEVFATTRFRARTGKMSSAAPQLATPSDEGEEPLLEPGTMVDERFAIEAHVASGGMGDVYRANHVHLKRAVALKLLKRIFASDPEMWARFKREAELVSQLESQHVVRVFDFGQTKGGQPYLAMEYVDGPTLDEVVAKGPLSPGHATRVLRQVCEGLAEAHALGVIHRDLKPPNIILGHKRDGAEVAKILDFGIARLADRGHRAGGERLTQLGIVVGTPSYLSPEQALADELDERTDIYALGCVAYELLTGRPPFVADDLRKVISLHLTAAPAEPSARRPELAQHPALCAVVLKALAKEKDRRFQTVKELAAALEAAAGGVAPAPSAPPRAPPVEEWAEAPAPMAPEDWPPPSVAAAPPQAPTPELSAAADDFFSTVGGQPLAPSSSPSGLRTSAEALQGLVDGDVLRRLQHARDTLPPSPTAGVTVFLEVMGPPPGSALARLCLGRALEAAAEAGAFVDGVDEDGALLGFATREQVPSGRALKAVLAMRDAVVDAGLAAEPPARASIRAAVVPATIDPDETPLCGPARARARQLAARFKAGELVCAASLGEEAQDAVDLSPVGDACLLTGRRARNKRTAAEPLARGPVLEALDRRIASFAQGVVASVLVRGAPGAGRSTLAHEVAARARQKSLVAVVAHSPDGPGGTPFGALASLLCATCGVPLEHRAARLRGALAQLKLQPEDLEAALVLAGVTQLPQPLTAGQAVQALRAVLKAGAAERPVVLLFDGLEEMDEQSLEAFRELVSRPATRELIIGLGDAAVAERCGGVPGVDLPLLSPAEMSRLAAAYLDAVPGPRLQALLAAQAQGLPGVALDWLWWLDDRGSLSVSGKTIELVDSVPDLTPQKLLSARIAALPLEAQRVLEAAALGGETFDGPQLSTAFPRATPAAFQVVVNSRFVRPTSNRRWRFNSLAGRQAVLARASPERAAMHRRLAAALIEQGRADASSVELAVVARHLTRGGDGPRAAQVWKHAADAALARRVPRDAVVALRGLAQALALVPASPEAVRARVDALARAAGMALSAQDAATARAVVDDAAALEKALPAPSPELALSVARVHRSEARRARATEALQRALQLAKGTPLMALVEAERAESREQEGDLDQAAQAFESALSWAEQAKELARWHGEVDLPARLLARLAAVKLQKRDVETARKLLDQSLARWKTSGWAPAEARVLANQGTALAAAKQFEPAAKAFEAAAAAAARSGDLLFRARALLQQARALTRHDSASARAKAVAAEARKVCTAVGWDQGRTEAASLA